jgi:2-polyprenyl-3-methyl-5-hydroxy-6-metoxy-1,4-benzoquinol methylase
MSTPVSAHQEFNKYEQQGPYHWHQMRQSLKRFNAGLAARYEVSTRILRKRCMSSDVRTVVDIGCGDGYFTNRLGEMFPSGKVRGFDFSNLGVEYACRMANAKNVSFLAGDAFDGGLTGVDLLTATDVIEHVYDAEVFLQRCRSLLSDNGAIFLSTPIRIKEVPDDPYHVREFFLGELKALVESCGFAVIEQAVSHDHALLEKYGRRHSVLGMGKMRIGKYGMNFSSIVLGRNPFVIGQCTLPTMQYLFAVRSEINVK